ncbi:MAG: TldD/PmbA family protein [Pyrinomonadaceae bacterium]
MDFTRREFLKSCALALGTTVLPTWVYGANIGGAPLADVDRESIAEAALKTAKSLGAEYCDVRVNRYRIQSLNAREKQIQRVSEGVNQGFGVRVLYKGTWGFAASSKATVAEARRIAETAFQIAKANSAVQTRKVVLAPTKPVEGKWNSEFKIDPFDVGMNEKIQFLLEMNDAALSVSGVSFVNSSVVWVNEQKYLATSDGSRVEQYLIRGVPSFSVTAVDRAKGDFETRNSLGQGLAAGWEYTKDYDWIGEAKKAGEEAVMKLSAKPIEAGTYDLVLDPSHLFLTIHESVGHSTELDRALLWEANYAGTSFLTPDKTGKLKFGSDIVNFVADRNQKHGLATVGWDDEGVPSQDWHLVKDGMFVGWQTTRDLAPLVGEKASRGCLHADSWSSVAFPRMPNVSLTPAKNDVSVDELVRDVEKGIMIFGRGSYSIDQQRYNFQFGGQTFWEISKGKVSGMLRDVAYQSKTTDFWGACDGLGGKSTYVLPGTFSDGKGQPGQSSAVSHGCPAARFRAINVLNTAASTD